MRPIAALVDNLDAICGNPRVGHRVGEHAGIGQLGGVVPQIDDRKPRRGRIERRMVLHFPANKAIHVLAQAGGNHC